MRSWVAIFSCLSVALFAACIAPAFRARDKNVWNYEGGLFVITNGSIPNGPCFRLAGRAASGDFFDHLKRIDQYSGTIFQHGAEEVQNLPDHIKHRFLLHLPFDQTV